MTRKLSDEQLILKYSKGDIGSFELLYERHRGPLFRYCQRSFNSSAIAEECFQDIWIKIINNRTRYKPKALFSTYLYRIAKNAVIDLYRKEKKRQNDIEYVELSNEVDKNTKVSANCSDENIGNLVHEVRAKIAELPFDQRNTLLLKLNDDLSIEEIARISDCGKETVKSRLRYANKKLRALLTQEKSFQEGSMT